jgi:fibronectin type 3 domain-containing protein
MLSFSRSVLRCAICVAFCLFVVSNVAFSQGPPDVLPDQHHDVSPPLRNIPAKLATGPLHDKPLYRFRAPGQPGANDPVIQSSVTSNVATTPGLGFAGVGNGDYGFRPNAAPPDTNGAVGATQYVQWVNESFAVFDKTTGALLYGPAAGNTLWSGFGGGCQTNNDGDPIAQYDKVANRWVMAQFSVSTTPYLLCVAVSATSDATGSWYRYSFSQPNFPDYPKVGVWPDGYYVSYNMFQGNFFAGGRACSMDRSKMLAGQAATQICFQLSTAYGGLLPSDLDGTTAPPSGSPNYFVAFGSNSLQVWKFHSDFAAPANATFTGPTTLSVAAFSEACGGGTCIPQGGVTQKLDSLGDRLMYRLAYRNFSDHQAMVVNHSVTAGTSVGVRWYELRVDNSQAVSVFQQGTYAPDANYRWMGSIAMDKVGNMALGYSISSSSMYPSIRYTGRVPTDAAGTMEAENNIFDGGGSQSGQNLNRWGDYSAMAVDPVDDCTFWYTNEYEKTTGAFNWSTRIASFKFPSCSGTVTAPAAPTNLAATAGNAQVGLTWTASNGATSYNVLRGLSTGSEVAYQSGLSSTSYTDTGVSNGTTYYYVVQAANSAGTSGNSNEASATPTCSAPAVPGGLSATPGNAQVALSWSAVSGAASYNVKRGTDGVTYPTVTGVTGTGYTDTSVSNGTTYFYVVSAVNSCGESQNSSAVSATPTAPTVPAAPTGLTATAGRKRVTLAWNAVSGATSYNVLRNTTGSTTSYTAVATGVTSSSFNDLGLTPGVAYYYVVQAVNAAGASPNSNQASATPR